MADFSQTGTITTLHRLQDTPLDAMEQELERFARARRIGLVLPCLFDEFSRPALRSIVEDLRRARYIDRIVVSLGRTSSQGLAYAQAFFAGLPTGQSRLERRPACPNTVPAVARGRTER